MRVCICNSTGALLESQSGDDAPLDALIANAVAAGYSADDVEVKVVGDAEYQALLNPPPTLEQAKVERVTSAAAACEAALTPYGVRFCPSERDTWTDQVEQAKALLDDPSLETPPAPGQPDKISLLRAITAQTGESLSTLAMAIDRNREAWLVLSGLAIGQRQAICDRINAATTVDDVLAVDVTITLSA